MLVVNHCLLSPVVMVSLLPPFPSVLLELFFVLPFLFCAVSKLTRFFTLNISKRIPIAFLSLSLSLSIYANVYQ